MLQKLPLYALHNIKKISLIVLIKFTFFGFLKNNKNVRYLQKKKPLYCVL